jgi:methyl-accepting chemotaxis protein
MPGMKLTFGKKLWGGYVIMLAITTVLGFWGYLSFLVVDGNLSHLSKYGLQMVEEATGVQRETLKALLTEKEYLLHEKEDIGVRTKEALKALAAHTERLGLLARENNDPKLEDMSKEIKKLTEDYLKLYDQAIKTLKENRRLSGVMDEKGDIVLNEVNNYMTDKNREYLESADTLAIVNRIHALALKARLNERSYAVFKDQKYADGLVECLAQLMKEADELDKKRLDQAEKNKVEEIRKGVEDYFMATNKWMDRVQRGAAQEELDQLTQAIEESGERVGKITADFLLTMEPKVNTVASAVFLAAGVAQEAFTMRSSEKNYILTKNTRYWEKLKGQVPVLEKLYMQLNMISVAAKDKEALSRAMEATKEYFSAASLWMENDENLQKRVFPAMKKSGETVFAAAEKAEQDGWKTANVIKTSTTKVSKDFKKITVAALVVALVIGVVLAVFMVRAIKGPLSRAIAGLTHGADQVASAAQHVSESSQQLAEGASEQAASLQETSSFLEEVAAMTKKNAEHARQVDVLMKQARQIVAKTSEFMNELTASMKDISTAGEQTSKIVKTIDEIAFQTNLLALNAAVEAARAGEAGAGFAVVADEVRNLAMRAAESAKNTAALIEETIRKVKNGSEIVTKAVGSFAEAAVSAEKVGNIVAEIAAASNEQARGVEQVSKTVLEMERVVQANAASAEQSAAASQDLTSQAVLMREYIGGLVALVGGKSNGAGNDWLTMTNNEEAPLYRAASLSTPLEQAPEKKALPEETQSELSRREPLLPETE